MKADIASALATFDKGTTRQMKRHDDVVLSYDLPFFGFLGLPNAKVVTDVTRIRKLAKKHHLSKAQIAELPNRYNHPVAVMRDADAYIVLTDLMARADDENMKPVRVVLRPTTRRDGEVVFMATALSESAADERKYYEPLLLSGLMYTDENKIAGLKLEEETESILRTQASGDQVLSFGDYSAWATPHSIPNSPAGAQLRFSIAQDYNLVDPFADAVKQPVDFLLAHRIFAANGKPPTREETLKLLKAYGSNEAPRDVLARAISLSQDINAYLEKIGQNPEVVRAVAAAGLALEAKGAQTRAKRALMKFDAKAADAKRKIDRAYRRQVDNATGIAYHEMLSYYGLDFNEILKAMEPPVRTPAKPGEKAEEKERATYELTDADRAAVDAAVVEAVRKSGITVDNPLAMVAANLFGVVLPLFLFYFADAPDAKTSYHRLEIEDDAV